jgi:ABC-2 type transport system permease protein
MNIILSYYKYNIKVLLQDKLPLIWSVLIPVVFLLFNQNSINNAIELRYWWTYIIITSYIYGVGVYSVTMKESGVLKTLFSVSYQPLGFFLANLFTQITYSFTCVFIFDIFSAVYLNISILEVLLYSFIMIILSIPIAFISMVITLPKKIHVNSLSAIINILMMIFFISMSYESPINKVNPLLYYSNLIAVCFTDSIFIYTIISSIFIVIGLLCINKFTVIPIERR